MANRRIDVIYWTLWSTAVVLYLAWPLAHLEAYAWSNDEGLYIQQAALANAGYPLYREVLLNKPPLLVWILQCAFRVAGQTLVTARLTSLSLSLFGLIAFVGVVGRLWGRWAGLASVWVLLGLPEVPVRAHAVMNDLPAMAFALVALGAALSFRQSGRRFWVALVGAGYACTLLIHPLLIYMALPLAVILFSPGLGTCERPTRRAGWQDAAMAAGVFLILVLLALAAVDRSAFWSLVVGRNYRVADVNVQLAPPTANWDQVTRYASQRWTLVWLAGTGTAALATSPAGRRWLIIVGAWFVATLATLLVWSPVWEHYLIFLAVPVVAVASGGLATVGGWIVEGHRGKCCPTWWRVVLIAVMFIGTITFVVGRCGESMPQPEGGPEWSPEQRAAWAFLEATVSPDGFVVADDPLLVFAAGRFVPPTLTEASYKWIRSGYLTTEDVASSTIRYKAQAVLFGTGRLALLPSYERWIATLATEQRDFGPLRVYRLELPPSAPHAALSYLGSAIALDGYALSSDKLQAGNVLTVTLFWRREGPITEDYHVFVHLVDDENYIWGQHDGPALMGAYPTAHWAEGLLLPDPHIVELGAEVLPGRYRLMGGMYRWPSLERLPALLPDGSRWPDDRIVLAEVYLTAPGTR